MRHRASECPHRTVGAIEQHADDEGCLAEAEVEVAIVWRIGAVDCVGIGSEFEGMGVGRVAGGVEEIARRAEERTETSEKTNFGHLAGWREERAEEIARAEARTETSEKKNFGHLAGWVEWRVEEIASRAEARTETSYKRSF